MTFDRAVYDFLSGFGLAAYAESAVPHNAGFPRLTYALASDFFGGRCVLAVDLWFLGDSEAVPNQKAAEIALALGPGGVRLDCADGAVWLQRGSPWCLCGRDAKNPGVKRRTLNILADFLLIS